MGRGRIKDNTVSFDEVDSVEAMSEPECPEFLTDGAKEEWERITGEMRRLGLLQRRDMAIIAIYCQTWDAWRRIESELGIEVKAVGSKGQVRTHPLLSESLKLVTELRHLARELRLTPSARGVKVSEGTKKANAINDFRDFADGDGDDE